jgi:hypothetical protein
MEGRLEEPLFCKNIFVSKFISELVVDERVESSREERKVLRLCCSPAFVNLCTEAFRYNTKVVFPAYEVFVFLCVMNGYSLNVFLYLFMYVVDVCK